MISFSEWRLLHEGIILKSIDDIISFINNVGKNLARQINLTEPPIYYKQKDVWGNIKPHIVFNKKALGSNTNKWVDWVMQKLRINRKTGVDVSGKFDNPDEIVVNLITMPFGADKTYTDKIFYNFAGRPSANHIVYHVTPTSKVEHILKKGIKPSAPKRTEPGTRDIYHSLGRVFFSSDPYDAKMWIDRLTGYRDNPVPYSIIVIDLDKAGITQKHIKLDKAANHYGSFLINNRPIPPEAIITAIPEDKFDPQAARMTYQKDRYELKKYT